MKRRQTLSMWASGLAVVLLVSGTCCTTMEDSLDGGRPFSDFDRGGDRMPSINTLRSMADILAIQGMDSECVAVLEQLIADYPDYAPAYNDLAELFMRNGMEESAIDVLNAGLKVAPEEAVLRNNLGMCYTLQGQYALAFENFLQAASKNPSNTRARANMAMALAMLGRDDEALALFMQVLPSDEARANMRILTEAREKLAAREGDGR